MGVIWFTFQVLQLLPTRITQQNICYFSKSTMKHEQKVDWKLELPLFSYGHQNDMFVDSFTKNRGPPNCVRLLNVEQLI